jgi:Secretion system effector C (SseC) like family
MASTIGTSNITTLLIDPNSNVGNVQNRETAGAGIIGQANQVPEAGAVILSYTLVLVSLSDMLPSMGSEDVSVLMSEIAQQLKDTQMKSEQDKYKADTETKRTELANKKDKLDEATQKLEKAAEEKRSAGIFGWIKAAFQLLGALIMAAIGAVVAAIPGLQVVGGLMIASAVVMAIGAVDSMVKLGTGMGIAGNIAYSAAGGGDAGREAARKADMGFAITLAVVGIALAIASVATGNVASVANSIKNLADAARATATLAQQVGNVVNSATTVVTAGLDIGAGVVNYQATEHSADAKRLQADAKEIEGFLQMLDDAIDMALTRMMAAGDQFNAILDAVVEAMNDRGSTLARAKFTG